MLSRSPLITMFSASLVPTRTPENISLSELRMSYEKSYRRQTPSASGLLIIYNRST